MPLGKQYAGMWTLSQQMQAISGRTWTGIPAEYALFAWGANGSSQLGINSVVVPSSPVQVGSDTNWLSVSQGGGTNGGHRLATKTDGTIWAWGVGSGAEGALGLGTTHNTTRSSPVQIGALTNWSSIAAGRQFSAAVKTDGSLWTWGNNGMGCLGDNTIVSKSSPIQVGSSYDWYKVSAWPDGEGNCFAIKTDGTLWGWGTNNASGQRRVGDNSAIDRSSPVQIGADTNWASLSTNGTMAAIKSNGTLWMWGTNDVGQLGQNTSITPRSSPIQVGALTTWSLAATGQQNTVAVTTGGTMYGWGVNSSGALGLNDTVHRSSPVQIGALTTWEKPGFGLNACFAIKTDKTLWAWGTSEAAGQLGLSISYNKSSPVQVGTKTDWFGIFPGQEDRSVWGIRLTPGT
jgi:alpha-tubulin suppressor-like RCC1 family protein